MGAMRRALALALIASGTFAVSASAAGPAVKHTAAGTAAAKMSLLTLKDLGNGWTSKPDKTSGIQVSCTGYQPSGTGIVETGVASSPSFAGSSAGPFVVQQTSVYATAAQASVYWKRAVTTGLLACLKQSLSGIASQGINVKIASAKALTVPKITSMTAGYRVVATLDSAKQKNLKTYLDWILVGHGKTVTEIVISSFQLLPLKYEYALGVLADNHIAPKKVLPTA
jgi:hypothetical protein